MIVSEQELRDAFNAGGYTINERFEECGFVYFPFSPGKHLKGQKGRDHPDQGRVFFKSEAHEYLDTPDGEFEKQMDITLGMCRDSITTSPSWERTTDRQQKEIEHMLKLWVIRVRQIRGKWNYSLADKQVQREAAELEEAGA